MGLPPGGPLNNGTTGYGVRFGWRLLGAASHGSVNAAGTGITSVQFGQFPVANPPHTQDPIPRMYAMLWTPSSYSSRTVTFAVSGHTPPWTAGVIVDIDGSVTAHVYVDPANVELGAVTIPIVPDPPALAPVGLIVLTFRGRHRETSP